jgi:hypothetical protein
LETSRIDTTGGEQPSPRTGDRRHDDELQSVDQIGG